MNDPDARIDLFHLSWRVRVPGQKARYFSFAKYDGPDNAKQAARKWRDKQGGAEYPNRKLSDEDREAIAGSTEDYQEVAERYGISPNYVNQLRRERK